MTSGYVQMMKSINEFDPNGSDDDGGVAHPSVQCIMPDGCVHGMHGHRCATLGMCGCAYTYAKAREPGGYKVTARDNPVADALIEAGMVTERRGPVEIGRAAYNTKILRANDAS